MKGNNQELLVKMNKWKTYKLGEIVDVLGDGIHGTPIYNEAGDYYFINGNNLGEGYIKIKENTLKVDEKEYLKHKKNLTDRTLLLSINGTLGNVAKYRGEPCILGKSACYFNISESCERDFIYYIMISPLFRRDLENMATGTTIKNVSLKALRNYEISLPPLTEQKRIADILSAIDDKIELNRRINANLEQQAQALYKSWFVDNKKDDWEEGVASDYYNITIGKTPPRKETKWFSTSNKDHVWISISDMGKHGMYLGQSSEYLTQSAIEKFNIVIVPDKTVLLSFKLTIGRVVISDGNVTTNEAIAHFNTNDQNLLEYTYLSLKNYEFAALGSTSSIATAVNSKTIKSMRWIMPNRDLINQFHEKVGPLFNMIKQNEKEINNLSTLRDTLLPKLMSGEIKV